jgi:site-specific DNA-cytosine methylase
LLENVKMKKDFIKIINENLWWIEPILIDSALVSAQSRKRLYWVWVRQEDGTYKSIEIPQPDDKGIFLKDILEDNVDDKYFISQEQVNKIRKWKSYQNPLDRVLTWESKCPTITARGAGEYHSGMILLTHKGKEVELPCATQLGNSQNFGNAYWNNKAYTLRACNPNWVIIGDKVIRKLTPVECERLQTLPDGYTDVWQSDAQRYKQLWNWRTVNVIVWIFRHLPIDNG